MAVADLGGFAPAARALRVSPSAVTRAVAALEGRYGVALFHRTTRSVRLTDEGAAFLPRCRQALTELGDAEKLVMGTRSEPQGTLAVTAPVVFGRTHVVPAVSDLLARHKRLAVRLLLLDRVVHLVEEGIDVAVRIGEPADSSLRSVRLGEVGRVLVASPDYLGRRGVPARVAELREHDVVAFTGLSPSDEWRFGREGRSAVHVRPRLVLNSADAAIAAVERGVGIGRFLSYQVRGEIEAGRLVPLLDEEAPAPAPVHLLFHPNRADAPPVRAFVETMKAHVRTRPLGRSRAGIAEEHPPQPLAHF